MALLNKSFESVVVDKLYVREDLLLRQSVYAKQLFLDQAKIEFADGRLKILQRDLTVVPQKIQELGFTTQEEAQDENGAEHVDHFNKNIASYTLRDWVDFAAANGQDFSLEELFEDSSHAQFKERSLDDVIDGSTYKRVTTASTDKLEAVTTSAADLNAVPSILSTMSTDAERIQQLADALAIGGDIQTALATLEASLQGEIGVEKTRAEAAEQVLTDGLAAELVARGDADAVEIVARDQAILVEKTRAELAEQG